MVKSGSNSTVLIIKKDRVRLENYNDLDSKDGEKKVTLTEAEGVTVSCDKVCYILFDSILMKKQLMEYKKLFNQITWELNDYGDPLRITADNGELKVEYWLTPRIEEDRKELQKKTEDAGG